MRARDLLAGLAGRGERDVRRTFQRRTTALLVGIDVVSASVAAALLLLIVPMPAESRDPEVLWGTAAIAGSYATGATVHGVRFGGRILTPVARWIASAGPADVPTQRRILDAPFLFARRIAWLWMGGASVAAAYGAWFDPQIGITVGFGFALSGLFASTVTLLVAERALRPLATHALAQTVPRRRLDRALAKRLVGTWVMTSGTGLLGLGLVSTIALTQPSLTTVPDFATTTLVLTGVGILSGLLAIVLAARATAEPVEDLIGALGRVERGDLAARVKVWDATELGVLQAGFNAMASGLEERERLRDLFGRHVGEDVAAAALLASSSFDGDVREVTVLFVDLVGSTRIAETTHPQETIRLLNAFFDIVIDVVHRHDGWINKFQGDAALAIWGAPVQVDGHARLALAAARTLAERLLAELPEIAAGIGVSGGTVVTGNVGGAERYEYTVIGDPVNEAARLTDLAKAYDGHVVANAALLDLAGDAERERWVEIDPHVVRGRSAPTRLVVPLAP